MNFCLMSNKILSLWKIKLETGTLFVYNVNECVFFALGLLG